MILRQLLALVLVRRQISYNQQTAAGRVNRILTKVVTYGIRLLSIVSFLVCIVFAPNWFRGASEKAILVTWSVAIGAFLFFWLISVMENLQRKDMVSIEKILHLPVSLKSAFLLNYVSTFCATVFVLLAPTLIGLSLAMTIGRGSRISLSIAMILAFLFFVTAFTYFVQGWANDLMKNKRMRGILVAGIPFLFVLGLLIAGFMDIDIIELFSLDFGSLPAFGWIPFDIMRAEQGNWLPGILTTIALMGTGVASLYFSYKSSIRAYTGAQSKRKQRKSFLHPAATVSQLAFVKIPFVSEPASAVAYFNLRSLVRAPEALMALLPMLALLIISAPYLLQMNGFAISPLVRISIPYGIVFVTMIGFPAFLFSCFSYDRDGFRSYILSPVRRSEILLGKNIAVGLPTILSGWFLIGVAQIACPQDSYAFVATLVQVPAAWLLMCILGNFISIFFPLGLMRGSMKPVNAPIVPSLVVYLGVLVGPAILLTPMIFAAGLSMLLQWSSGASTNWLYLLLSVVQLAVSLWLYSWTLGDLGKWLWSQEPNILQVVANIPE